MSDLVERYVHQVGRHVPQKERAEIQAELRSQIHDQLDDRYEGAPTADNIADVLRELGDPRQLALSYGGAQYLIGPELYPVMMSVLRRGWMIVPVVVAVVNVIVGLFSGDGVDFVRLLVRVILNVMQALWIFSTVVVAIFAILQHSGEDIDEITGRDKEFDPVDLPEVDDPAGIDKADAIAGMAFGTFAVIVLLYFLRVGGLINLADPGEIIPVPVVWQIVLILGVLGQVIVNLVALRRNRWTIAMLLVELALGLLVAAGLYFAVFEPLFVRFSPEFIGAVPDLADIPFFGRMPLIAVASVVIITLVESLTKIVKLLFHRQSGSASDKVKAGM